MTVSGDRQVKRTRRFEMGERAMQLALVPLSLIIFAPVVFLLLFALFALLVIFVRMAPGRPERHSGWRRRGDNQMVTPAGARGTA